VTTIDTVFDLMDTWRHFPSYQLERRADIYFALYLPEVLETKLGVPIHPGLVPEFPVRIGMLYPNKKTHASYKIDYVALSAARDQAILVELKTDARSRRIEQDQYLLAAQKVGFHRLLEGLLEIFRATNAKRKYGYLLAHLEQLGMLRLPDAMRAIMARPSLRGITKASQQIEIQIDPPKTLVVYVQPHGQGPTVITFRDFAEVVRHHEDAVSQRFARSLRQWTEVQAGAG
jgi:hypothetical protein